MAKRRKLWNIRSEAQGTPPGAPRPDLTASTELSPMIRHAAGSLLVLMVSLFSLSAAQGDGEVPRKTLTDLRSVLVVIGDMESDIQQDGLSQSQIRTDVELKLRQAGINVLSESEWSAKDGSGILYVGVGSLKTPAGYAYDLSLKLEQFVFLARNPGVRTLASTWNATGGVGLVGLNRVDTIRDHIRDIVDEFMNAYLAGNPKSRR